VSKNIVDRGRRRQQPVRTTGTTGDDRVRRSKETVLRVTSELLIETGLGGVSVDEVSRRSGVAKTTIYRHWPTRSDLVLEACSQMSTTHEVPDTGDFEGDITALLTSIAKLLSTARWSSVLPSIIDAAERAPDIAKIHSSIQMGHATPFHEVIGRAVRRGEIPKGADPKLMIATLLGPLFYRRWFSREPLDDKFVKAIIKNVMAQL
jgi:AcrR family transcriptional regulator